MRWKPASGARYALKSGGTADDYERVRYPHLFIEITMQIFRNPELSIFCGWNCGLVVRKSLSWLRLNLGKASLLSLARKLRCISISFCIGCIWRILTRFHFPRCWIVSMLPGIARRSRKSCVVSRKKRTAAFRSQPFRRIVGWCAMSRDRRCFISAVNHNNHTGTWYRDSIDWNNARSLA